MDADRRKDTLASLLRKAALRWIALVEVLARGSLLDACLWKVTSLRPESLPLPFIPLGKEECAKDQDGNQPMQGDQSRVITFWRGGGRRWCQIGIVDNSLSRHGNKCSFRRNIEFQDKSWVNFPDKIMLKMCRITLSKE